MNIEFEIIMRKIKDATILALLFPLGILLRLLNDD
jgi:hypothetical protein